VTAQISLLPIALEAMPTGASSADMKLSFVAAFGAVAFVPTLLGAQPSPSASYTSLNAEVGKPVRIGVYAEARKDCSTTTKLPIVRVVEVPTKGTFTVRPGKMTTNAVAGCPSLQVPVQTASYTAREGGSDHISFNVTFPDGEISLVDVTIHITQAPKSD
jgi:hypothetical protein